MSLQAIYCHFRVFRLCNLKKMYGFLSSTVTATLPWFQSAIYNVIISVVPIPVTATVFILIQTPIYAILWIYHGIHGATVNTVPMHLFNLNPSRIIRNTN